MSFDKCKFNLEAELVALGWLKPSEVCHNNSQSCEGCVVAAGCLRTSECFTHSQIHGDLVHMLRGCGPRDGFRRGLSNKDKAEDKAISDYSSASTDGVSNASKFQLLGSAEGESTLESSSCLRFIPRTSGHPLCKQNAGQNRWTIGLIQPALCFLCFYALKSQVRRTECMDCNPNTEQYV